MAKHSTGFKIYDPDGRDFYDIYMAKVHGTSRNPSPAPRRSPRGHGSAPKTIDELYKLFSDMQGENDALREEVVELKYNVNRLTFENANDRTMKFHTSISKIL